MLRLTLIARVSDGLPLAASMEDDTEMREFEDYKKQRKKILQQLQTFPTPPEKLSIESGPFNFQ
jgi:vesicle transport protein SEC22